MRSSRTLFRLTVSPAAFSSSSSCLELTRRVFRVPDPSGMRHELSCADTCLHLSCQLSVYVKITPTFFVSIRSIFRNRNWYTGYLSFRLFFSLSFKDSCPWWNNRVLFKMVTKFLLMYILFVKFVLRVSCKVFVDHILRERLIASLEIF